MMKFGIAALALCLTAWGQSQNLLNITPKQDGSATGEVRFLELFANGQNYVGLKAPNALAGSTPYTLPVAYPVTSPECLKSTTAGVTSWGACDSLWSTGGTHVWRPSGRVGVGTTTPAHPLDVRGVGSQIHVANTATGGGYMFSAVDHQAWFMAGIEYDGTNFIPRATQASILRLSQGRMAFFGETGLTTGSPYVPALRWEMDSSFNWVPGADNSYSVGVTAMRPSTVFGVNADFAPAGVVNNYTKVRKLEVAGATGETTFWDVQAAASMAANSWFKVRDNAGSRLFQADRATSGTPLNSTQWFTAVVPAKRATADGDAVNDSVFPDLGGSSARWSTAYIGVLDATSSNALLPNGAVSLGASGSDWNRLWVGGVEATSFVRPQADNGGTDGTSARRWSAGYWYDGDFANVLAVGGGAAGFYDALNVRNTTVGAHGSCVVLSATDSVSSTVYGAGRICGRYTSNNFSSEEVTIQTATGSGTYANAITITNGDVTIADTLFLPSGAGITGQSGSGTVFESGSSFVVNTGATLAFNAGIDSNLHPAADDLYSLGEAATPRRWKDIQTYGLTVVGNVTITGTCTGCSSLPVTDTTGISKGSSDATKILRFEADGFTTGTTRTLTPQNASYTIAGIDIAQTFTGAQTFNSGTNTSDLTPRADLTYVVGNGGARYSGGHFNNLTIYSQLSADADGGATLGASGIAFHAYLKDLNVNGTTTLVGNVVTGGDNTIDIGSSGNKVKHVYAHSLSLYTVGYIKSGASLNVQSGGTFDINSGGTLSANGAAGQSATITVRASGGLSDCTIIFTNGIKTGGTC